MVTIEAWTLIVAALTLAVEIVSVGLLFYTIRLGQKATDAAVQAASVAQTSMLVGQRSYLSLRPRLKPSWIANPPKFGGLAVEVDFYNSGQTPARNLVVQCGAILAKAVDNRERLDLPVRGVFGQWTGGEIAGQDTTAMGVHFFVTQDLIKASAGEEAVFVVVIVDYETVFSAEKHRVTMVRRIWVAPDIETVRENHVASHFQGVPGDVDRGTLIATTEQAARNRPANEFTGRTHML